jgi:hypothetical protein
LPLHALAGIMLPPEQEEGRQTVPDAYLAQPPKPLHRPLWPQLVAPASTHIPCGSFTLAATARHSPSLPAWSQLTQAPVQDRLQQMPSAQKPDSQSANRAQVEPSGFFPVPHFPAEHGWPPAQSLLLVQDVKHVPLAGLQL